MKQALTIQKLIKINLIMLLGCLTLEANAEEKSTQVKTTPYKKFCTKYENPKNWLDRTRAKTFSRTCRAVSWIDSLFGYEEPFDDENFRGKVTVGFKHDEREGFDPKVRLRIKSKLPNVSKKMNAFIGRVEEDSFISDSKPNQDSFADAGVKPSDQDEAEWLIGLGYSDPNKINKGFDYSIGAKISSGLNPYAKIRYKYLFDLPEDHYLRASQTLFWRGDDGYGTTTNLNYTYLASDADILELGLSGKFTEDEDQWEWVIGTTWFHQISKDRGISSRIYVRGEEENTESIPEYGVSITYRKPFLRPWLFLETGLEHRWIRESADDDRDGSLRFGLQIEMHLGDYRKKEGK